MIPLLLKSIWHYRRINIVIVAAIAISTAVIGGSLIVGDSVRFSLKRMTQQRLGQTTHIMRSGIFFRQQLAKDVQLALPPEAQPDSDILNAAVVAPAILLTGSIERHKENGQLVRAGSVAITGITSDGWNLLDHGGTKQPFDLEVVLGFRTAQELDVKKGDEVSLWMEIPSSIPRDSLLGERSEVTKEVVLTVAAVLSEHVGASRFDLHPGQQLPLNAFVDLATVQQRLGLEQVNASKRDPTSKPARINSMIAGFSSSLDDSDNGPVSATNRQTQTDGNLHRLDILNDLVKQAVTLKDVGVVVRANTNTNSPYLSVETDRMILDDATAETVQQVAEEMNLASSPTVIYLLNEIFATDRTDPDERYSMYSIVAGVDLQQDASLGSFRPADASDGFDLQHDQILLTDWLAADLGVHVGDSVTAKWHAVGSDGDQPEIERSFAVAGILTEGEGFQIDSGLTPVVEGVTDVEDFGDIRQPFEMDMERLTERDDEFWDQHKAAPKAFLSLATAEEEWGSRFGKFTSIRIESAGDNSQIQQLKSSVEQQVEQNLQPKKLGIAFLPVRERGLQAAVGANNFTQLFLGFSFFLILSAIILAALMFRLGVQQRIRQMGLMSAVGWPPANVRRIFVGEGICLAVAGSAIGCAMAVLFAKSMVWALTTIWIGAVGTQDLVVDVQATALVIAFLTSVVLAGVVIMRSLKVFQTIEIRDQLAGNSDLADQLAKRSIETSAKRTSGTILSKLRSGVGPASIVLAVALPIATIAGLLPDGEAFGGLSWQMVGFFVAGFACLNAGLYLLKKILTRHGQWGSKSKRGLSGLAGLAFANAARNPTRSLLTCSLIAFATFVIVAVAAGRRNPLSEVPDVASGNGGFRWVAQSSSPILFDLSTENGLERLGFYDEQQQTIRESNVYSFSVKPGSDASCVNLYQTRIPTMLGASDRLIQRGGFRFADTPGDNPWTLLKESLPNTEVSDRPSVPTIPILGDMNTLTYSLKKGMGAHIFYPNDDEPEFALQVVGLLDGSVFQGVLLLSDKNLKRVDPEIGGASYFLIEATEDSQVATVLESGLNDFGVDVESVNDRITSFLAVQNTYLSTFQMLGALGLLIGTFGLAAVMVRNVIERQREISLMRAVGFSRRRISQLIIGENLLLLFWGIELGTAAALLAMLPHLKTTGGDLQWITLLITLGSVVLTGAAASLFAVRAASKLQIRIHLASE